MRIGRMRRTLRCYLKYGRHRCPHVERHSPRPGRAPAPTPLPPTGPRHVATERPRRTPGEILG